MILILQIFHVDGAFAKYRNQSLSSGNIEYDLNVMSNTKIRKLKESITYFDATVSNSQVAEVSIEDCCKFSSTIRKLNMYLQLFPVVL